MRKRCGTDQLISAARASHEHEKLIVFMLQNFPHTSTYHGFRCGPSHHRRRRHRRRLGPRIQSGYCVLWQ